MFLNNWKFVVASVIVFPSVHALVAHPYAHAADSIDQLAYCFYVTEQAQAQRDLLRTPIASAGMTQPETGLPLQLVAGASVGLSSVRKASLTMDAARTECELYKATTGAQQNIQYALSGPHNCSWGSRPAMPASGLTASANASQRITDRFAPVPLPNCHPQAALSSDPNRPGRGQL